MEELFSAPQFPLVVILSSPFAMAFGSGLILTVVAVAALLARLPTASAYDNGIGRLPPMGWNVSAPDDDEISKYHGQNAALFPM